MPYSPKTWATGDPITPTDLNRVENGIASVDAELATHVVRVGRSNAQSIPHSTTTVLNFLSGATVYSNPSGMWVTGGGLEDRFTVQVAGYYVIGISLAWESNATGTRAVDIRVGGVDVASARQASAGNVPTRQTLTTPPLWCAANAEIFFRVTQTSGGNLECLGGAANQLVASAIRIGGA